MLAVSGCMASRASDPATPGHSSRRLGQMQAEILLTTTPASLRQKWWLFRAEQQLDAQCMQNLGFKYLVTSPGLQPSANALTADAIDLGHPASYGVSVLPTAKSGRAAEDQYVSSLRGPLQARYDNSLEGSPSALAPLRLPSGADGSYSTGGCIGSVRKELYGSVRAAFEDSLFPQDVTNLFMRFLTSSRPYASALGAWQKCMASDGLKFASPDAAIASIQALAATPGTSASGLTRRETMVASTDAACDARTHLRALKSAERIKFVQQLPESLVSQLQGIYVTHQEAVNNALRAMDTTPGRM